MGIMHTKADTILQQLAAISLEKCLLRLSRVSAGTWRMTGLDVAPGTLKDALAGTAPGKKVSAVHFTLKAGGDLSALMLFDHDYIECISTAFTGLSFPRTERTTPAEEVMLLELGNIVLNALASSVLNALKKFSMPAVPQFVEGEASALPARLDSAEAGEVCRVISGSLTIQSGQCETVSRIFALVPESMALEIEKAAAAGTIVSP